jgi:DNA (cytosine-5)-methyltransferase 1
MVNDLGERKPRLILIENVPGFVTSHGGADFRSAMLALSELGYSVDTFIVNAAHFVPQSRERLFVVCQLGAQRDVPFGLLPSIARPQRLLQFIYDNPAINWRINNLPNPPSRTTSLADVLEDLPQDSKAWWSTERSEYLLGQMSAKHRAVADTMITGSTWSYGTVFRRTRNGASTAELRFDGVAGCLRTPKGGSAKQILFRAGFGQYSVRLLSARECARLMGADDFVMDVPLDQALFGFGDAVCVPVVEWIAKNYLNLIRDGAG